MARLRPDLFLVNESAREVVLLELTCPWDGNITRSHDYKQEKYAPLVADLSRNYKVFHFSVEVSVRGQISKDNRTRLKSFAYRCCRDPRKVSGRLNLDCSKISLLCSYSIFCARKEPSWSSPRLLTVRWFIYFFYIALVLWIFMLIYNSLPCIRTSLRLILT